MVRQIVITGVGIVSPFGIGKEVFWEKAKSGENAIRKIDRFNTEFFECLYAGYLPEFNAEKYLPSRLLKRIDRFTQYALIASNEAIEDSMLMLHEMDKNRVGVYVGNMFGGWEFTDRELRNLYNEGAHLINPFLATAWFPAAPQGEITIFKSIKGHSKTFDSGRTSGLSSIGHAAISIATDRIDIAIAGASETPITPFMLTAIESSNKNNKNHYLSKNGMFDSFGISKTGWVPGEGAAFVILEDIEHAQARNANIYGMITGFGQATESCSPNNLFIDGSGLKHAIKKTLQNKNKGKTEIDLVIADGTGTEKGDLAEAKILNELFSNSKPLITTPKSSFGDLFSAGSALDIAIGAMSLKKQAVLPTYTTDIDKNYGLNVISKYLEQTKINNILINSRGHGGIGAALKISAV